MIHYSQHKENGKNSKTLASFPQVQITKRSLNKTMNINNMISTCCLGPNNSWLASKCCQKFKIFHLKS